MKKILLALSTVVLFAACSSPKYTYYFDRIPAKSAKPVTKVEADSNNDKVKDIVSEKGSTETSGVTAATPSAPIQEETLVASSSREILNRSAKKNSLADKDSRTSLAKTTKTDRKALLKALREYRAIKKAFPESVKEGDPSKNVFAVIGFVSVILSLLVGLVNIPVLSTILWILGLAFCIVGLKSEQRYLAIAGLIILGVLLLLGLLLLLFVVAAFGAA